MRRVLAAALVACVSSQHYCWPCAKSTGVIGKKTFAATEPNRCYDWFFRYLNSAVPGTSTPGTGPGYRSIKRYDGIPPYVENFDAPPNVLGLEVNECGTIAGDLAVGMTTLEQLYKGQPKPAMTEAQLESVANGLRLPVGEMHECPCAVQGRAHIINASVDPTLLDFTALEAAWGTDYVTKIDAYVRNTKEEYQKLLSTEEAGHYSLANIFGLHAVYCPFHESGPCTLADVEEGVKRATYANNFSAPGGSGTFESQRYSALMDNNLMLWIADLGPLLDAFLRDGVPFYPMRWSAPGMATDVYSVLASPCGKVLLEFAASVASGRGASHFHAMAHPRAIFTAGKWNDPASQQPVVPLRVSRPITAAKLDEMLSFYGASSTGSERLADALNFQTDILDDTTDATTGVRAITLMLSPTAKTHLQLWVRNEPEPSGPPFPDTATFTASAGSNQINGGQPVVAHAFCKVGMWTVGRYTSYIKQTHELVMTPPPADPSTMTPPAGKPFDVFIDDHISWDCTAPTCNISAAAQALYASGKRMTWVPVVNPGDPSKKWFPYTYDPLGFGLEFHWYNTPEGFAPSGLVWPGCFSTWPGNDTCPGAFTPSCGSGIDQNSTVVLAGISATFDRHVKGVGTQNLTLLVADYAETAVVEQYAGCTGKTTRYEGKAQIRQFFVEFFATFNNWTSTLQTDWSTLPQPSIEKTASQVNLLWVAPSAGVESEFDTFLFDDSYKITRQNTAIQWRCPSSEKPKGVAPVTAAVGWILFAIAAFVVLVLVFSNEQFKRSQQLGSQGRMLMNAVPDVTSAGSSGAELK